MWLIVALILIAALMLVVEIVLIPGISVAGIAALLADAGAVWMAFARYGSGGGMVTLGVVIVVSAVVLIISLRGRTWRRFSLKDNIEGTSQPLPEHDNVQAGDRGVAITRLAPMGKVTIGGRTYEAKSIDAYVDESSPVEVTGFENFNVVVKKITN